MKPSLFIPSAVAFLLSSVFTGVLRAADTTDNRWSYELIDQIALKDINATDGSSFIMSANTLIDVRTVGNDIVLELRTDVIRELGQENDPPANVASLPSGQALAIPVARIAVSFEPSERGAVSVDGVDEAVRELVEGLLAQGPAANILVSGAAIPYAVQMESKNEDDQVQEFVLRSQQENGELWVDLTFGAGLDSAASVGGQGWQLPIELSLPEQQPLPGLDIAGKTVVRYASVQVGPENETVMTTTLQTKNWLMERKTILRPQPEVARDPLSDVEPLAWHQDLATISAWNSSLALSQAGVQRLAGLREVGLAAWLGQLSADSTLAVLAADSPEVQQALLAFEAELPAVAAPPRGTVAASDFAQVTAEKSALEIALADAEERLAVALGEDWNWEFQAVFAALTGDVSSDAGDAAGDDSAAEIFAPRAWLSYLWGDTWRYGIGVGAAGISASSPSSSQSWLLGSAFFRGAYHGETWNAGLNAGVETGIYDVSTPLAESNGMEGFYTGALDVNILLTERWGVYALGSFGTAGNGSLLRGAGGASYQVSPGTAFLFNVEYLSLDFDVDGDATTTTGFGLGIGSVARF